MSGSILEADALVAIDQGHGMRQRRRLRISARTQPEISKQVSYFVPVSSGGTANPQQAEEEDQNKRSRPGVSARTQPEISKQVSYFVPVSSGGTANPQQAEEEDQNKRSRLGVSARTDLEALTDQGSDLLFSNSTLPQKTPSKLEREFERLFQMAREEVFEDGMESNFSKGLTSLIKKYSNSAIDLLTRFIITEAVNPEVASEALRWIGHIEHPASYRYRRWLLERSLFCSSARVRDGAALGLASLDDPHAIPYLKRAIERETYTMLRKDMKQVLVQLESDH